MTINSYLGNDWDTTLCPDPATLCSQLWEASFSLRSRTNILPLLAIGALDGADYDEGTYGITTSGDAPTPHPSPEPTSVLRVYLWRMKTLTRSSNCSTNGVHVHRRRVAIGIAGLNGALYFSGRWTPMVAWLDSRRE
ncbi:Glucanase [Mycena sanguinolenta]|uniref:Glucanase n=1 Tax=Mycena sanguinolenta TaxID=230812 RepID=A0A8H6TWX2_9AGAR|nr:Glucanase [Mycena sanguinolenta]